MEMRRGVGDEEGRGERKEGNEKEEEEEEEEEEREREDMVSSSTFASKKSPSRSFPRRVSMTAMKDVVQHQECKARWLEEVKERDNERMDWNAESQNRLPEEQEYPKQSHAVATSMKNAVK